MRNWQNWRGSKQSTKMLDPRPFAIFVIVVLVGGMVWMVSDAMTHDNAWQRDRDACLRAGGVPIHRHMPDGSMAQCAAPLEVE